MLAPVVIHLINRMRHKPQPWAAMRFLTAATQASTSHAKLRQLLILLFRVMAVAMLLFFLARPLAGGWMGWMLASAPDTILILLDRSASMEKKVDSSTSRREHALKLLAQAAAQFQGTSHIVLIDSATRTAQQIQKGSLLLEPSITGSTDTAADYPALMQSAFDYLVENRAGSTEIWIASDLQRSNWHPDDPRLKAVMKQLVSLPQKLRFRMMTEGAASGENISIALQDATRRSAGGGSQLELTLDFQRSRPAPEGVPLKFNLDGSESSQTINLEGQAMRWRNALALGAETATGWGSVTLPGDANLSDNSAYFIYGPETKLQATIVASDAARYFKTAVAVVAKDKQAATLITPAEVAGGKIDKSALVIWQGALPQGTQRSSLEAFVQDGGTAIFFPDNNITAGEFLGVTVGATETTEEDKPWHVGTFETQSGPLAKTREGMALPVRELEFHKRIKISQARQILASFEDGSPLLARQTLGKGELYVCASSPMPAWSNLGDGPVLVPMLERLMQQGAKRFQKDTVGICGQLPASLQNLKWDSLAGGSLRNPQLQAGVYRSGATLLAVNRPAEEDEPDVLETSELNRIFEGASFQLFSSGRNEKTALQGEVWRLFLFAMLFFLVAEGLLILPSRPATNGGARIPARKSEVPA